MSKVQAIDDPDFVEDQYRTASNLNARIRLHQEFSTNKLGWFRWVFEQLKFAPQNRVLELGCGPGDLWLENLERIPEEMEIVLSDFSEGMVEQAQKNLVYSQIPFQFRVIDAQSIPFEDDRFDIVIANHMLYHVPDRDKALSEIRRVLIPDGYFYCSTIGDSHLQEISDLLSRFDPQLKDWGRLSVDSFTLENGSSQLGGYFANVSCCGYPDSFIVTDADLITAYILSGRIELSDDRKSELAAFVVREFKENDGRFHISKDSGIFDSYGII